MAVVTFTYNPEPAPACYPADVNGLAQLLTQGGMLAGNVPDQAGGGIFVGSAPPSSSLTYKVWFKIDGAGRPLGPYQFYNGNWRKVYTGAIGDVKMYHGSGANFDGNGLGVVGSDVDGWAICNGNYGTPNMTDARFPMGGAWNGSTWSASGQGARGGSNNIRIAASNLPVLHVGALAETKQVTPGGEVITTIAGFGDPQASKISDWPVEETQGSPNTALSLPQYNVFGFIMFIGYA